MIDAYAKTVHLTEYRHTSMRITEMPLSFMSFDDGEWEGDDMFGNVVRGPCEVVTRWCIDIAEDKAQRLGLNDYFDQFGQRI